MSQPVTSGVATAGGAVVVPGLVSSAASLVQASGRQLGSDTTPKERAAEPASPEANTPATPVVPAAPVVTTDQKPAEKPAEKPKFSAEVEASAKAFGVDISGFADDANAQFAINQAINHAAALGARPAQQPQAQVPTEDEDGDDEDFDFAAITDPKVAAHVRKLQEQANGAVQFVQNLQREHQAQQQAIAKEHFDKLVTRAKTAIDNLKSADFGVGDNITYPQQLQRRNLMDTTANIIAGARASGREVEVEDAIKAAMTLLGKTPGAEPAPGPKSLKPGTTGPGGAPAPARPYFGKVRPAWDLTGVTSEDSMQRGLAEIFVK